MKWLNSIVSSLYFFTCVSLIGVAMTGMVIKDLFNIIFKWFSNDTK